MSSEKVEHNNTQEQQTESDSDSNISNDSESEYEEFDLSDNPNYQVLAAFFEDDDGNNICDHIAKLTETIDLNSKKLDRVLEALSNKVSSSKTSSDKKMSKPAKISS